MPKLTELTAASSLANTDLLVVTTNTSGSAVSNSVNVATLAQAVQVANPLIKTIEGDSGTIISSNSSASVKIAGGSGVTTATSGNTLTITVDSSSFSTGFTVSQINTPSGNVVSDNRSAFVANIAQSNGVLVTASGNTITFTFDPSTINTLTDVTAPEYNSEGNLPANNAAYNGHTVVAGGKLYHGANNVFNKHFDTRDYVAGDIPGSAVHKVTVASESSGNKYLIDGTSRQSMRLVPGLVYWFDQTDNSNSNHPLAFSKTFGGTHNSGSEIANNTSSDGTIIYQRIGTPGQAGSYTKVQLQQDADELYYYYCTQHSGMGGEVHVMAADSRSDIKLTVAASGSSAYTFSGGGARGTNNETLYVMKGFTYEFDNYANLSGHPFQLRVSSGGSAYSNGVVDTNSTNGKVVWTVPQNAANIVYQCTSHSGMVGNIIVLDEPADADITFTVGASGSSAYTFSGGGAQGTNNETLYVSKGFTYKFDANSVFGSHPFQLRVSDGGSAFSNGVTTTDGRVTFIVPQNLSSNIVYQCTSHGGMVGTIVPS
jgi:plastocyanin